MFWPRQRSGEATVAHDTRGHTVRGRAARLETGSHSIATVGNTADAMRPLNEDLGVRFLAFVLNCKESVITKRLEGRTNLTAAREAVLAELLSFLISLPQGDSGPVSVRSTYLAQLAQHSPDIGSSWVTATRIDMGGTVEVPRRTDRLGATLMDLARDTFPMFLLPRKPPAFGVLFEPSLMTILFHHPRHAEFEDAVMKDSTLRLLFPDQSPESGIFGYVLRSTGHGGGLQLSMFADGVLRNAWLALSRGTAPVNLHAFAESTLEQIYLIRRAVQRKRLTIPALVGITGVRLPPGRVLTLPWGRLREITDDERDMIPSGIQGKLTTTTEDGTTITIDYAGDLIMEASVPYEIKILRFAETHEWPRDS